MLLALSVLVAFNSMLWPWWDFNEARFVSALLKHMQPSANNPGIWLGPRVEGVPTALVTGRMSVTQPPRADSERDFFPGKIYEGCAFAEQQFEVQDNGLFGGGWKPQGAVHVIQGSGYKLGEWKVDPRFFDGQLSPRRVLADAASPVPCPPDEDECRVVERCVLLTEYSILGSRGGDAATGFSIDLPNESLIDYPLFQSDLLSPPAFDRLYKLRMAERIMIYPYLDAIFMLCLGLGMLVLSRREVIFDDFLSGASLTGLPVRLLEVFSTNRNNLDHLCCWLVFVLPLVPIAAYHAIIDAGLFNLLSLIYGAGYFMMVSGFYRRIRHAPEDLPPKMDAAL